jgi:hypothetical protein
LICQSQKAANHHQLVAGDVQTDVFEIVLAGLFDVDAMLACVHESICKRPKGHWQGPLLRIFCGL